MAQLKGDVPRRILREIVAIYGSAIWSEPVRFRGLLLDYCGGRQQDYEPQINILVAVLETKIVDEMQRSSQVPVELLISLLTQRLRAKGFDEGLAHWGVESWAEALEILPPSEQAAYPVSDNVGDTPSDWRILGESIRGAMHIRANKPNQDAILWKQSDTADLPPMLAISDGHGSDKYFRSHIGAQFAVRIAIEEMDVLVRQHTFPITRIMAARQLFTEALPKNILTRWQKEVKAHWDNNPTTPEEQELLREREDYLAEVEDNPATPYGATLLAVLVTPSFILYLQLGDGDIVVVSESRKSTMLMPFDKRLLANNTTSLCSTTVATAQENFRIQFHVLQDAWPALIMVSTDGYSNSFTEEKGILKAGSDFLDLLSEDGVDTIRNSLNEWLTKTSEAGSGDDISLGLLFRMSALRPSDAGRTTSAAHLSVQPTRRESPTPSSSSPDMQEGGKEALSEQTVESATPAEPEASKQQIETPLLQRRKRVYSALDKRQTIVVSKEGNGQCTTINDALQLASSKARILVEPGIYTETLEITREIEIIGQVQEPYGEVIIENSTAPCLRIKTARRVTVQGITLKGSGKKHAVVNVSKGRLNLSRCKVISDAGTCIAIHGEATQSIIERCEIVYGQAHGVLISQQGQGTIKGGTIQQSDMTAIGQEIMTPPELCAIAVRHAAHLSTQNLVVEYARGGGILIDEDSSGELIKCEIVGNYLTGAALPPGITVSAGIEVRKRSSLTLSGGNIARCPGNGIFVHEDAKGIIKDCELSGNALAQIEVAQNGRLIIQGGQIHNGHRRGILVRDDGQGEQQHNDQVDLEKLNPDDFHILISGCRIYNNTLSGVKIIEGGHLIAIKQCFLYDNNGSGLLLVGNGRKKTLVDSCEIKGNVHAGIEIRGNGKATITSCKIYEGHGCGILCHESEATIRNCKIYKNEYTGIECDGSELRLVEECWISQNMHYAMVLSHKSTVTLEKCHFEENTWGIYDCKDGSKVISIGEQLTITANPPRYMSFLRLRRK